MSKYYTPSIEEFHVGFEYRVETEAIGSTYMKESVIKDADDIEQIFKWFPEFDIEVKHLDREDIESLGFVYDRTYGGLNEDMFKINDGDLILDCDYDEKYCRIYWGGDGDVTRFSGTIKNKSELKRILKQLGI
tara:strand:+ start:1027 stop:1425 length:399 start_codon:yes stop_codon:yes gene_type:complete